MHLEVFYYITILTYLNHFCERHIPISFPVIYLLLVFSRYSCQFVGSSAVKFLFHNPLSLSSHFISGCPRHRLPSSDQVISFLGHLLPSYVFIQFQQVIFQRFQNSLLPLFFSDYFICYSQYSGYLQLFSKNPFQYCIFLL
jgi:hypothetical protein